MPRRVFIDSWGWFAHLNRRDKHHARVRPYLETLLREAVGLVTSDPVIVECLDVARKKFPDFPTQAAEWFSRALAAEHLSVLPLTPEVRRAALLLKLQYRSDSRVTFTDCCNAALMDHEGLHEVLSGDSHYRDLHPGIRLLPEDDARADTGS